MIDRGASLPQTIATLALVIAVAQVLRFCLSRIVAALRTWRRGER